jgi:predicted TIM-barrel fold metal-dependent hydrolase
MIIDVHVHPRPEEVDYLLDLAERQDMVLCLLATNAPGVSGGTLYPSRERIVACNDYTAELASKYPKRIIPMWYLNQARPDEACAELERRVKAHKGPQGVKLHSAVLCTDPRVDPLMELCATLGVPVLIHIWKQATGNSPNESTPMDFRAMALRHPTTTFFMGHSGGDFIYGAKAARGLPNVYMDTSGCEANSEWVEILVRHVGADHVTYGSDLPGRSFTSQLAKVTGAAISDEDKEKILWKNARAIFDRQQ